MQINRRGASFADFLIVIVILAILAGIAVPKFITTSTERFQDTFGLETSPSRLTEEEKVVVRPLIEARLKELANHYFDLIDAKDSLETHKDSLLQSQPELTPDSVNARLRTLRDLNQKIQDVNQEIKKAANTFTKVRNAVIHFGFEANQDMSVQDRH